MSDKWATIKLDDRFVKLHQLGPDDYERAEQLEKWRLTDGGEQIDPEIKLEYLKEEIRTRFRIFKSEVYKIGQLIYEAKQICRHGEFQKWIEDNFTFTYKTANNYMLVYQRCLGIPEVVEKLKPTTLYELCAPKFPDTLRQEVFKELEEGDHEPGDYDVGVRRIIDLYKAGKLDPSNPKIDDIFPYARLRTTLDIYLKNLKSCHSQIKKWITTFKDLSMNVTLKHGGEIVIDVNESPIPALMDCASRLSGIELGIERYREKLMYAVADKLFPDLEAQPEDKQEPAEPPEEEQK